MSAVQVSAAPGHMRLVRIGLLLLRLAMAMVFTVAAIPKIREPDLFALAIFNYHVLPAWGVNTLALVLPWVELCIGACLGLGIWRRASALVMAALLVVFMGAYISARARGLDLACGCFEVGKEAKPASPLWVVLRDLAFLAAAVVLVRFDGGPRPVDLLRRASMRRT